MLFSPKSIAAAALVLAASVSAGTGNAYDGNTQAISLVDAWPAIESPSAGQTYYAGGNLTVTWCVPQRAEGTGTLGSALTWCGCCYWMWVGQVAVSG